MKRERESESCCNGLEGRSLTNSWYMYSKIAHFPGTYWYVYLYIQIYVNKKKSTGLPF